MQKLYYSQMRDTTRIIFSYGQPRLKIRPAWAPSNMHKLESVVTDAKAIEKRGIRGSFHAAEINEITQRHKRFGKTAWMVKIAGANVQFTFAPGESHETLENVENAINAGRAFMLSHDASTEFSNSEFARAAILVEKARTAAHHGFEAAVHCTVSVVTRNVYKDAEVSILLRDASPLDGDLDNELQYMWFQQTEGSTPPDAVQQEGESDLHVATRMGDTDRIKELLEQGQNPTELFNAKGWTPLHVAAARGLTDPLRALIPHSASNLNVPGKSPKESPLGLAAQ